MANKLILASSSPFRKHLLDRLHLEYECYSPEIDETPEAGESAENYVCRLALAKAQVVATLYPEAVVIGSDQCALLKGKILGKPGTHANALKQLKQAQGETVVFHTAVCVMHKASGYTRVEDVLFEVVFRRLSDAQLEHYLRIEQPYNCAGSFKSEGYGACLFSKMRGDDPSALIGLPMLSLVSMLEGAGIAVV